MNKSRSRNDVFVRAIVVAGHHCLAPTKPLDLLLEPFSCGFRYSCGHRRGPTRRSKLIAFGWTAPEVVPQSAGATLEEEQYHDVRKKVGDEATANLEALDFCS